MTHSTLAWPIKDIAETLDYGIDWSKRLADDDDKIATSTFTVLTGGVTITQQYNNDTTSTVWLSGGTAGQTAKLKCVITTDSQPPRIHDIVVTLPIVDRAA